jgi:hypothetical protein
MRGAAVALAAVVVLAGCGTDTAARTSASSDATASDQPSSAPSPAGGSSDGPSSKPSTPGKDKSGGSAKSAPAVPADAPACGAVWRDGLRLARHYDGCVAGGQFVRVDQEPCSFGQQLVRYGTHFYAVRGGPVNRTAAPLTKDRDYRGAIASCRA